MCWWTIYFLPFLTTIGIQTAGGQANGTTARLAETEHPLLAVAVTTYVPSTDTCAPGPIAAKLLGPVQDRTDPGEVAATVAGQPAQVLAVRVVLMTGVT